MKHIHFLGISGRGSAGVAVMMQRLGWKVTGSDSGAWPPMSEYLDRHEIFYYRTYEAEHIQEDMDIIVVGGNTLHVDAANPEYLEAKRLHKHIVSWPELLGQYVTKHESVVVAGTYGKTTITALLTKMLQVGGQDPSFMIGEATYDFPESCVIGKGEVSVIEGDEHPTLGYSDKSKFEYFLPKHLILTSVKWDHFNIYPSHEKYMESFSRLVQSLPTDGSVIIDVNEPDVAELVLNIDARVYKVSVGEHEDADFWLLTDDSKGSGHYIWCSPDQNIPFYTKLLGLHNAKNLLLAITQAHLLQVAVSDIVAAIRDFRGIYGRLELLAHKGSYRLYLDQGQHPQKARGAVEALAHSYPECYRLVLLDTQASVLHDAESLNWYKDAYISTDEVLVAPIRFRGQGARVTGGMIVRAIQADGVKSSYMVDEDALISRVKEVLEDKKQAVVLCLTTRKWGVVEKVEEILHCVDVSSP